MNYEYTDHILEIIRERGQTGATLQELAIELNLNFSLFIADLQAYNSPVWAAYNAGILQAKEAIQHKQLALARNGSTQAAKDSLDALNFQSRKNFLTQLRDL